MQGIRYNAAWLASLPDLERERFVRSLSPQEAEVLLYEWPFWARPSQLPPEGDWNTWLLMAGRGFGKSRTGAQWVIAQAEENPGSHGALVASTPADVRDVMIEGESGILNISPPWFMPRWEPSKRRLSWPNGATATTYSGHKPDGLRGPNNAWAWCDELAAWRYPQDTWDQLQFTLRSGDHPRVVVTTTPRPIPIVKELLADSTCVVTRGSTYENKANLAPTFLRKIVSRYEGTRLGRQELNAEILEDNPNALWQRAQIEACRVSKCPPLTRIVVGVDPAATSGDGADETGIIVAGIATVGGVTHCYVLEDCSLRASPSGWATQAVAAYHRHQADRIVGESNQGGEMVEHTIRTIPDGKHVAYRAVHASRGKQTRAEPVSALYEQGLVHHIGCFCALEDQMCEWEPGGGGKSPDRLDALVWTITELMVAGKRQIQFS